VFDVKRGKWFKISRGAGNYLYAGFSVQDSNGIQYAYGFDAAGYMYRLENGETMDGDTITHTLKTAAIAPFDNRVSWDSFHRGYKLVQKSKGTTAQTVAITHYGDSSSTGTTLTAADPTASGYRLSDEYAHQRLGPHVFHEYQMTISTDDETTGFEPVFFTVYYETDRPDVR
jgi:hypothetical protein